MAQWSSLRALVTTEKGQYSTMQSQTKQSFFLLLHVKIALNNMQKILNSDCICTSTIIFELFIKILKRSNQ